MPVQEIAIVYIFASATTAGKEYQTLQYADGSTSCNCKGWTIRRRQANGERSCIHTRHIDCGTAARHATAVKEYGVVTNNKKQQAPQRAIMAGPARRVFEFNED